MFNFEQRIIALFNETVERIDSRLSKQDEIIKHFIETMESPEARQNEVQPLPIANRQVECKHICLIKAKIKYIYILYNVV